MAVKLKVYTKAFMWVDRHALSIIYKLQIFDASLKKKKKKKKTPFNLDAAMAGESQPSQNTEAEEPSPTDENEENTTKEEPKPQTEGNWFMQCWTLVTFLSCNARPV